MATTASSKPEHNFPAARATAARARGPIVDPRTKPVPIPSDPRQESVYALIPIDYVPPPKERRYVSVFAGQTRKEYEEGNKPAASMGPAKVELSSPKVFLKKGEGRQHQKPIPKEQRDRTIRKAPVPKEPGQPVPASQKDFIKQNALDNINSVARKTHKQPSSYTAKKDYGRTPDYLKKRIEQLKGEELARAQHMAQLESERHAKAGVIPLPEEERVRILEGLKSNWEKLNSDYSRLSLTVDTVPKIARKVSLEQQLQQYEELIDRFSHTNIHVDFNSVYH